MFLQNYSHYSVLDSILRPAEIVDIANGYGHTATALTDINSLAGCVQFHKACKDSSIKPIMGITIFLQQGSVVLLAKNYEGFKELFKILSLAIEAQKESVNYIKVDDISKLAPQNLIALSGHIGSSLYNILSEQESDSYKKAEQHLDSLIDIFGLYDTYVQLDRFTNSELAVQLIKISQENVVDLVNTCQIKYSNLEHSKYLYNVIKCKELKCKLRDINHEETFFEPYYDAGLDYSKNQAIIDKVENYDIGQPQILPKFQCPDNKSSEDHLRDLCRQGFKEKGFTSKDTVYVERIKEELEMFANDGLTDYFLTLADIVKYTESQGYLVGHGRGSSAGCLTAYLIGITKVDPIKYNLSLSRFFHQGRKDSLPDIDVDFPPESRKIVFDYITNKYGQEYTSQVVTYQTFMGKAALKAIMTAEGDKSFSEMNAVTKNIVDKSRISDELQQMKEQGREPSVILWALENKPHKLQQWVELNDDGELSGPMAKEFEAAIALEGIKSAQAKHAAGMIITKDPTDETVPMIYDKDTNRGIVGLEYEDAEKLGCTKLDILGLSTLSKIQDIINMTRNTTTNNI